MAFDLVLFPIIIILHNIHGRAYSSINLAEQGPAEADCPTVEEAHVCRKSIIQAFVRFGFHYCRQFDQSKPNTDTRGKRATR